MIFADFFIIFFAENLDRIGFRTFLYWYGGKITICSTFSSNHLYPLSCSTLIMKKCDILYKTKKPICFQRAFVYLKFIVCVCLQFGKFEHPINLLPVPDFLNVNSLPQEGHLRLEGATSL